MKKEINNKELNNVDGGKFTPNPAINQKTKIDTNDMAAKKVPTRKKGNDDASLNNSITNFNK